MCICCKQHSCRRNYKCRELRSGDHSCYSYIIFLVILKFLYSCLCVDVVHYFSVYRAALDVCTYMSTQSQTCPSIHVSVIPRAQYATHFRTISPYFVGYVQCFGEDECFSLAFGVPAVLMVISIGEVTGHEAMAECGSWLTTPVAIYIHVHVHCVHVSPLSLSLSLSLSIYIIYIFLYITMTHT